MEILINLDGMDMSVNEKVQKILKRKGYDLDDGHLIQHIGSEDLLTFKCYNETFNIKSCNYQAYRAHPDLIKAIKKVGLSKSSPYDNNFAIVSIPDNFKYEDWRIGICDRTQYVKIGYY